MSDPYIKIAYDIGVLRALEDAGLYKLADEPKPEPESLDPRFLEEQPKAEAKSPLGDLVRNLPVTVKGEEGSQGKQVYSLNLRRSF